MLHRFSRTELLLGKDNLEILKNKTVTIFGVGGVGSFAVEALARTGIGNYILIDPDEIDITNINRQIHAMTSTVGKAKVEVMKERILDINPDANVVIHKLFITKENISLIDNMGVFNVDYIIDAIDTITTKIEIIKLAKEKNVMVISSMGAGNKLNPTMFKVSDISKTKVCPVAKVVRKCLKDLNIKKVKVVYSEEEPIKSFIPPICVNNCCPTEDTSIVNPRKRSPGSISFIPSTVGLIIASEVIKDLTNGEL